MSVARFEPHAQSHVPGETGRNLLDLEPLRSLGPDALDTTGFPAIIAIILRELEIAWASGFHQITIRRADDLFNCPDEHGILGNPIPKTGALVRAVFDVQFADCPKPRPVEIRVPHILKIVRASDADLLEPWLVKRGFRTLQKLSHFVMVMLLALVTAAAPAFDDDPTDNADDDNNCERPVILITQLKI
jgi:hypothetical protein